VDRIVAMGDDDIVLCPFFMTAASKLSVDFPDKFALEPDGALPRPIPLLPLIPTAYYTDIHGKSTIFDANCHLDSAAGCA
jgi:hypothetical protein